MWCNGATPNRHADQLDEVPYTHTKLKEQVSSVNAQNESKTSHSTYQSKESWPHYVANEFLDLRK